MFLGPGATRTEVMDSSLSRYIFALLCFVGFAAIAAGALYEIGRQRRGVGVISPRHFRWRMLSAALWVVILVSLGYAVAFEWPRAGDREAARHMLRIVSGSFCLMVLATMVFLVDVWFTMKLQQTYRHGTKRDISDFARKEIARLKDAEKD